MVAKADAPKINHHIQIKYLLDNLALWFPYANDWLLMSLSDTKNGSGLFS